MNRNKESIISWLGDTPTNGFHSNGTPGPATSRGSFLGQDNSDMAANGEQIFTDQQNQPLAIATLLNHAQVKSDFHPLTHPPSQLSEALERYIYEIEKIPFYDKKPIHDIVKNKFSSGNYDKLINEIVALYDGFPNSYLEDIKVMIGDMARSVFGRGKGEVTINLFAAITISLTDISDPKVLIYNARLHMYHGKKGKDEVSKQDYKVYRNIYFVSHEKMKEKASYLAGLLKTSVDDWINGVTSPEEKDKQLCFQVRPYLAEYH